MIPLDDCCTTCQECGRNWCRDERPSPGEPYVCDDCWDINAAIRDALTQPNTDPHTWNGTAA